MRYDLHIHSNVSDGKLSREEIIKLAIEKELEYICFSEHNSFDNSTELKKRVSNLIQIMNGIEFDVKHDFSFHLLCYFNDYTDSIAQLINLYRKNTNDRIEMLLKNISKIYGIPLSIEYLMQYFNKEYITKRDVIDWLLDNGYANNVNEAAKKFTSKESPSYVPKYSLDFKTVINEVKKSGGITILAHPTTLKLENDAFEETLEKLINIGLDGIEVANLANMNEKDTLFYTQLAQKYNLLTSGGSDFHSLSRGDSLGVDDEYSKVLIKKMKKTN